MQTSRFCTCNTNLILNLKTCESAFSLMMSFNLHYKALQRSAFFYKINSSKKTLCPPFWFQLRLQCIAQQRSLKRKSIGTISHVLPFPTHVGSKPIFLIKKKRDCESNLFFIFTSAVKGVELLVKLSFEIFFG